MRYLICAGGTGGGVYPALAVHKSLQEQEPGAEVLWVGGEGGMETGLVQRAGIPFKGIPAAGLHGVGLRRLPGNLAALARGFFAARAILDEFKPDALFFTGGYVAGPVALAGMRIPSLVYVPDIEPGLALKGLSLFAARIAVTVEESKQFFSSTAQVVVTGYPSRPDMSAWERVSARQEFNIQTSLPVLLVWGGSRGARSINIALLDHLDTLLETMEIIHISGELDWPVVQERIAALNPEQAARYHAFAYLHEQMGAALAAADLVVSRAGASTLGEFPLYGLPAILVPYPYAWRYQKVNAEYLASRNAAIIMEDAKLKSGLYLTVERLLDTPEKLEKMRQAMTSLRNPGAAAQIAGYLRELAGVNHG